ncbi:MAG: hypothetical protein HY425_00110 [Candidatus Levybacteria bacterium]|nr:hypothetical protein [Candidatus Levybacteria bacterium]
MSEFKPEQPKDFKSTQPELKDKPTPPIIPNPLDLKPNESPFSYSPSPEQRRKNENRIDSSAEKQKRWDEMDARRRAPSMNQIKEARRDLAEQEEARRKMVDDATRRLIEQKQESFRKNMEAALKPHEVKPKPYNPEKTKQDSRLK